MKINLIYFSAFLISIPLHSIHIIGARDFCRDSFEINMRKSCFFFTPRSTFNGSACRFSIYTHIFSTTYIVLKSTFFYLLLPLLPPLLLLLHFFASTNLWIMFFIVPVLSYIVAAGAVILCYTHISFFHTFYHPHSLCANNAIPWHRVHLHNNSTGIRRQANCFYTLVDCSNIACALCYTRSLSL